MGVLKKKRNNQARIEVSQTDQVQKFPLTAVWTFVRVASSTLIRCGWISSVQDQLKTASQWKGSIP